MEPKIVVLVFVALYAGALALQFFEQRKTAAALFGLAFAFAIAFLAWPLILGMRRVLPGLRRTPLAELRRTWGLISAGFGLFVALGMMFRRPKNGRSRLWDVPRHAGDTDKDLGRILAGETRKDATLIGIANGRHKVYLTPLARERHMQVVGPTRSGKSQLLFALSGQDMRRGMPVFFMEAKGDRNDFDQFLKLAGVSGRARDVRYFNPQDPRSMTFNPIRRLPGQDVTEITNQLARAIGREPTSKGEAQDYYRSLDYARMTNMVEVFCATGREFTLKDCHAYFSSDKARRKALDLCDDRRTVAAAHADFKGNADTSGLTSAIRPWTTGNLGRLLNDYAPQIKLEEVFESGQLAYFAVPIGRLQVLANPLGRMVISGLLSVASARQAASVKPAAASVILDEFAEFATPVFSSFIATVASAKFWTVLSHQDLGQLKRIEGLNVEAFHSAVFNNTSGCKVCFKTPAPEDAEFWSATLGTYKTFKDTERYTRGFLGTKGTGEISRREVEEFKIHPNLLKSLSPGTALVLTQGEHECLAKTAGVARLLEPVELPELVTPSPEPAKGLDLSAEVQGAQRFDVDGRLI